MTFLRLGKDKAIIDVTPHLFEHVISRDQSNTYKCCFIAGKSLLNADSPEDIMLAQVLSKRFAYDLLVVGRYFKFQLLEMRTRLRDWANASFHLVHPLPCAF
jgi:hypothetical protein